MKNYLLTLLSFLILTAAVRAQYTTPGTGISWNLETLAENSGEAVTVVDEIFYVNQDIIVSVNDTIREFNNQTILVEAGVLIKIEGVLQINPSDSVMISAIDTNSRFLGFRFEYSNSSFLRNCRISYGGGIDLVNSDIVIDSCTLERFDKSNTTGTIDLFQSSPTISNCRILNNQGPAVLSAANGQSSPHIGGNLIYHNNTENTNMPQLNLGNTNSEIQLKILNNTIEGNFDKVGGIAVTTLAGGSIDCLIDGNHIFNNRYGITVYGFDITSEISNNLIENNNIENLPMQGGSGINYWGGNSNVSMVHHNQINGNLWGVTNTGNALPNLGQVEPDTINPGDNLIFDNGNLGEVYALYNNTPENIFAENNYWGSFDPDSAEAVIFHYFDDESLGFVDYLPVKGYITNEKQNTIGFQALYLYPNPATDHLVIDAKHMKDAQWRLSLFDNQGIKVMDRKYRKGEKLFIGILQPGHYFIYMESEEVTFTGIFIKK